MKLIPIPADFDEMLRSAEILSIFGYKSRAHRHLNHIWIWYAKQNNQIKYRARKKQSIKKLKAIGEDAEEKET